jgi:endoglucanase
VEPWPDHGDFAVDSNKAIVPAYNLSVEERWDDYDHLLRIANTAQARWVGSWENDTRVAGLARDVYRKAAESGRIGLIAYQGMRDYPCERAAADPSLEAAYQARTAAVVQDLPDSGAQAWIVLEPALLQTLDACAGDPRGEWLGDAAQSLAASGAAVYLDATGLAGLDPAIAAATVAELDLEAVAGFSLNSGQHRPTAEQLAWGEAFLAALSAQGVDVGARREGADPGQAGLGLVIDTSRNGVPLEGEQCNTPDAGIGAAPRLVGKGVLDALVWIKRPGESDGPCNGGFAVGQFDQAKALELARRGVAEEGL